MKFIVWNPAATQPPTKQFDSVEAAWECATSMVKRFGGEFYVCPLIAKAGAQHESLGSVYSFADDETYQIPLEEDGEEGEEELDEEE
jgi:hypothetical protein